MDSEEEWMTFGATVMLYYHASSARPPAACTECGAHCIDLYDAQQELVGRVFCGGHYAAQACTECDKSRWRGPLACCGGSSACAAACLARTYAGIQKFIEIRE